MIETPICSHCGHVVGCESIERGELRIEASGAIFWRGETVRLTQAQRTALRVIASAPTALSRIEIAERTGYRGGDPGNLVNVLICNIRKSMPGIPISTNNRKGIAWG